MKPGKMVTTNKSGLADRVEAMELMLELATRVKRGKPGSKQEMLFLGIIASLAAALVLLEASRPAGYVKVATGQLREKIKLGRLVISCVEPCK